MSSLNHLNVHVAYINRSSICIASPFGADPAGHRVSAANLPLIGLETAGTDQQKPPPSIDCDSLSVRTGLR